MFLKSNHLVTSENFGRVIFHETCHFVNHSFNASFKLESNEYGIFKFIDEGFVEWLSYKYINKNEQRKIYSNRIAYSFFKYTDSCVDNLFENWFNYLRDKPNLRQYSIAQSFFYFVEEKFGYEKILEIFRALRKNETSNSLKEYLNWFFETEFNNLIKEWQTHIEKMEIDSQQSSILKIVEHQTEDKYFWIIVEVDLYPNYIIVLDNMEKQIEYKKFSSKKKNQFSLRFSLENLPKLKNAKLLIFSEDNYQKIENVVEYP